MSQTRRPPHGRIDSSWTVRQVVPRSSWRVGTETCPACGGTVNLDGDHYQAELGRDRRPDGGSKLTYERRLLSFCDELCATTWLDGIDADESPTDE
ncbi:hypothetical protein [Halopelagius longus]|uniref:Small CPxCG-related zinc finger protein n=1 Tax=Halopelagius longus TaxID=1236180 RepID=A0A1H1AEC1_9EURY|nr:hypothetical protein [Halopelagius longus]RDI70348.1 hypothetical protein DWB78_00645 [Halopelagius longus]SDQ37987.1 hypothetical protein SAMN05216278_1295 [Halopelagius longus]